MQDAVRSEVLEQWMELARETGFLEPMGVLQMREPRIE